MNDELFKELMASVKEMDEIVKGEKVPERRFEYQVPEEKNGR